MVYAKETILLYSFGLNEFENNRYAMISKYGSIDIKIILKLLIIFSEK